MGKRYFWLKLRTDFFDSDEMRILSAQEKGSDYIVFWLKLLTRAVQEEQPGRMRYRQDVPYTDSLLAKLLNEDVDVVRSCMAIFQRMGMVVVDEEKTIWVEAATQLVGTETDSAERMRRLRENRDNHLLPSHSDTERHIVTDIASHSDKDVTRVLQKSDADYISNLSSSSSLSLKSKKDKITRETLGEEPRTEKKEQMDEGVTLKPSEHEKLVDGYGLVNTKRAYKKLSAYKLQTGKRYKSDYGAILSWVMREVQGKGAVPEPRGAGEDRGPTCDWCGMTGGKHTGGCDRPGNPNGLPERELT